MIGPFKKISKHIMALILGVVVLFFLTINFASIVFHFTKFSQARIPAVPSDLPAPKTGPRPAFIENSPSIHVFVSLAGNAEKIESDPMWGEPNGIKAGLIGSGNWDLARSTRQHSQFVTERCVFKHRLSGFFIVIDAYAFDQKEKCVSDFFRAMSGRTQETLNSNGVKLQIRGLSKMAVFAGINGIRESGQPKTGDLDSLRDQMPVIVMTEDARSSFSTPIARVKGKPILWTTGSVEPNGRALEAAIVTWISGGDDNDVLDAAAAVYAKDMRIGLATARMLLSTGK